MSGPAGSRRRPWPAGTAVLLRHTTGGRTWCALPVSVLHDDDHLAVLRIHEGTDWLAAFGPDGRRAHGWQSGWRLRRTTWKGDDGTYVVRWGRWYGTALFTEPRTGRPRKWYVNCQDPLRRTDCGFDTMDRELDVELTDARGTPRWKDLDRFRRLVACGRLPAHTARIVMSEARAARRRLTEPAFRDELTRWAGDPGPAPRLPDVLDALPVPHDLARFRHTPSGPAEDSL